MKFSPVVVVIAAGLGLALPARAELPRDIPNPQAARRSWVADNANVLDAQTERKLDDLIDGVKQRTGAEIAVVTVNNLDGMTPENFANDLFRRWGVGVKGEDNGVMLLAAISERKLRIETGYGIETQITDGQVLEISRSVITPRFKKGDYNGGLYNGTLALAKRLDPSLASVAPLPQRDETPSSQRDNSPTARPGASNSPFSVPDSPPSQTPFERPAPSYEVYPPGGGGGISLGGPLLLLMLLGGGGMLTLVWLQSRPPKCPKCQTAMLLVPENEEDAFLSDIQQLEESLGGREWNVWRCPQDGYQEIMKHDKWLSAVSTCPRCQNRTVTSQTQTLRYATEFHTGLEQSTHVCHNPACRHHWQTQRVIPRDMPTVVVVGGGSGGGFGGGGFGGGSSSHDSGGGSFGGGDSGGGGGTDSW